MGTINKREISYEGLVNQLESGEDGLYNLIAENSKNIILQPKVTITKKDIEEIPPLRELREAIEKWEAMLKTATGRDAFIIKRTLIEMHKDQYIIKNAYRRPIVLSQSSHTSASLIPLNSEEWVEYDDNDIPDIRCSGVSFLNKKVISEVLQVFPALKAHSTNDFQNDLWYFCQDFEKLLEEALEDYPIYQRIVYYKMMRMPNIEIQAALKEEFNFTHSVEYISALWRNKIPNTIAKKAQDDFITWYFTFEEYGTWKKCSRCGQVKLAHTRFFSINKTSKDGFYSICKRCRNQKRKK